MKIDAHQHFWLDSLPWMDDEMKVLKKLHLPRHLRPFLQRTGIDGTIVVQAEQAFGETVGLLSYAQNYDFIKGVVGWADLTDSNAGEVLDQYSANPYLVGVREMIQGERDEKYFANPNFNRGVDELGRRGLVFDILVYHYQLPVATGFVDRHPEQVFVLDHIAKPDIANGIMQPWRDNIKELAKRSNVYCKLSGLVTEAGEQWSSEMLKPYMETVLEVFGAKRMMFGSDWPVITLVSSYEKWHSVVSDWVGKLSTSEQDRIMGGTAVESYKLK